MSPTGKNLLLKLHVKRRALLRRYDDNALHQLRVLLRRQRSLLRHVDSNEAKALRRALGQLADATNDARDWDTLMDRARGSLRPRDFRRMRRYLEERRTVSHACVREMLRSDGWSLAVGKLGDFIERRGLSPALDRRYDADVAQARREVQRAWRKVQADEDSKHWHKLRLAIKELRYTFDSVPRDSLDAPMSKALKHCKRLQEMLGDWHDTVVHVQRVHELARGLDREAEGELHDVVKDWCRQMQREGRDRLYDVRRFIAGKGADLLG